MARWEDIHPRERASFEERLAGRYTAPFEETPWVEAPKLVDARVAIVTTAAIHRSDDRPFAGHVGDYRVIPGDIDYQDLAMTHSSTHNALGGRIFSVTGQIRLIWTVAIPAPPPSTGRSMYWESTLTA